jgi:hypothetical protein
MLELIKDRLVLQKSMHKSHQCFYTPAMNYWKKKSRKTLPFTVATKRNAFELGTWLNGRAPAWPSQGPEFKLQYWGKIP